MNQNQKLILGILLAVALLVTFAALVQVAAPLVAGFIMLAIPLVAAITFNKRTKTPWKIFFLGALAFIVSQIGHIPFNIFVLNPLLAKFNLTLTPQTATLPLLLTAIAFGLSAGVFEEVTRYIWYRFFLKDKRKWNDGTMLGLGHGGVEAIIVGISSIFSFIQISAYKNMDLSILGEQASVVEQTINAYLNTEWYTFFYGSIERFSTVIIHVALSLIVLQVFRKKNIGYLFLAILIHTAIDAFAVFGTVRFSVPMLEITFLAGAILILLYALSFRKTDPDPEKTAPLNAFSQENILSLSEIKQSLAQKQNSENDSNLKDSHYE